MRNPILCIKNVGSATKSTKRGASMYADWLRTRAVFTAHCHLRYVLDSGPKSLRVKQLYATVQTFPTPTFLAK